MDHSVSTGAPMNVKTLGQIERYARNIEMVTKFEAGWAQLSGAETLRSELITASAAPTAIIASIFPDCSATKPCGTCMCPCCSSRQALTEAAAAIHRSSSSEQVLIEIDLETFIDGGQLIHTSRQLASAANKFISKLPILSVTAAAMPLALHYMNASYHCWSLGIKLVVQAPLLDAGRVRFMLDLDPQSPVRIVPIPAGKLTETICGSLIESNEVVAACLNRLTSASNWGSPREQSRACRAASEAAFEFAAFTAFAAATPLRVGAPR